MKLNWRTIGEIIAVLSVVLSLVFVGFELRMSRSVALNDSFGQSTEITTALNSYITENSDIWLDGCRGAELSENEELVFLKLIGAWDNFNFGRWQRSSQGISPAEPIRWVRTAALNMHRYEGFRKYWLMHQESLATSIVHSANDGGTSYPAEVEEELAKLRAMNIPTEFPVTACGN